MSLSLSMKQVHIWHLSLKIGLLTSLILGIFQLWIFFFPQEKTIISTENENSDIYQSAYSANIWNVWVALSTRIWLQYQSKNSSIQANSFYKEIIDIGTTPEEKRAIRSDMITQNMLIIKEYLNLSRIDIKAILDSSPNRRSTLEGFISQLELRYKNSRISLENLQKQKSLLLADITKIEASIEKTKAKMEQHFATNKQNEILQDVDEYFDLRAQYTEAFTDIVFVNQFIKQHAFLNNYNTWILDTLINNKEAIINQSYVVIPDTWDQYLRPLELLFDEAEIKAIKGQ